MTALVLAGAGLAALAAAAVLLRSLGPAFRVARLLAATPEVSLAEAARLALTAEQRYVRVTGRISSLEEFPDEHDRPLVYRRRRMEAADAGRGWRRLSDEREAVPFGLELRSDYLAVDAEGLAEGLVVIERESVGRAADLPAELAGGLDSETPVRLVIEQVSAVEHATAAGVPRAAANGEPELSAGLGRPLILTTLDVPSAMRLLARGGRRRVLAAALLVPLGLVLLAAAVVAGVASAA